MTHPGRGFHQLAELQFEQKHGAITDFLSEYYPLPDIDAVQITSLPLRVRGPAAFPLRLPASSYICLQTRFHFFLTVYLRLSHSSVAAVWSPSSQLLCFADVCLSLGGSTQKAWGRFCLLPSIISFYSHPFLF